jgi:hypothetical protein
MPRLASVLNSGCSTFAWVAVVLILDAGDWLAKLVAAGPANMYAPTIIPLVWPKPLFGYQI